MNKRLALWIITLLVIAALALPGASSRFQAVKAMDVRSISMFQGGKFDAHYRTPREVDVQRILEEEGLVTAGTSSNQMQTLARDFMREWEKQNPVTPRPDKLQEMLTKEKTGKGKPKPESPIKSLVVPVEFPAESTFEWCGETVTLSGPLHNEIAPPGPRDNNTIWYEDTAPELYEELFFGVGPEAGLIVNHPNLGAVDLRGNTMANYFLEQSEGTFVPAGMVYPEWLQASEAEGYYGQDSCDGGNHYVNAHELVIEVIEAVMADNPDFPWQDFDGDGDGIVDNFTVIHAGVGQEAGGGAQGDFAIWSHASHLNWPTGIQACTAGSAGCPDRDIFVRDYSMDPENIDVGVIAEEFGHAAFGLPDLYTTDTDNSISNWAIMEAGAWNGELMGMQPAPFPLFFRSLVGWADPVEFDYTETYAQVKVGQLSLRPMGTEYGIKINLPDQSITTPNPLDTGQAWWSDVGDLMHNTIVHEFDLTGTTAPIFSFASYWSMEVDWDGGYVEVSTDDGATWIALPDMDGYFTQNPLSGNNSDLKWVLTGEGEDTLRFDLSAYAGAPVLVRLSYKTDTAVQWDGWWGDDFSLDDGATNLFFDDVEAGPDGWMTDTWRIVPVTDIYPRYYLAEWRNLSGFDRGLAYPYQTVYYDEDEWEVDRAPYSVPGMLLYYRDSAYRFDYTLGDSYTNPPSLGPKHGLIVVDSHSFPHMWDNYSYSSGQKVRLSRRVQTADATFTLQETTPFTIRLGYNPATGVYQEVPLETKTFGPRPAVSQFHDSMGYYPGIWYRPATGGLYYWDQAASAVVPATGDYTTRITWPDNSPLYELYGADIGPTVLGSGNPGDSGVQFGLHLAVVEKAIDGSWGMIRLWNGPTLLQLEKTVSATEIKPGELLKYRLKIINTSFAPQNFILDDPIPEHTTFYAGYPVDPATNSIHREWWVPARGSRTLTFIVRVNEGTPVGTEIVNEATLIDGALGDTATTTTIVK